MGKKVGMAIVSVVIMLFFLAMSIYQLGRAFSNTLTGPSENAVQVSGWIALILFLLSSICFILIIRSDTSQM
ncbi:hypothetical protein KDI_01070 [Dictyobacter arantiisoli]|uniref:Uncharacterized protein n=2 Tax=Dictyobacter arantiisoli TaxID=2014874 RepID=A0A5A5T6A2_9CHLR|nr:hypothetical protein KDI_01070 [Dictyobacter arantiisoli]